MAPGKHEPLSPDAPGQGSSSSEQRSPATSPKIRLPRYSHEDKRQINVTAVGTLIANLVTVLAVFAAITAYHDRASLFWVIVVILAVADLVAWLGWGLLKLLAGQAAWTAIKAQRDLTQGKITTSEQQREAATLDTWLSRNLKWTHINFLRTTSYSLFALAALLAIAIGLGTVARPPGK